MDIVGIIDDLEKRDITRYILKTLPDWFGLPESREEYIQDSIGKLFFVPIKNRTEYLTYGMPVKFLK